MSGTLGSRSALTRSAYGLSDHTGGWQSRAACGPGSGTDPATFFPVDGVAVEGVRRAKRVCGPCPVRDACLDWAVDYEVEDGIWGGLTEQERARYARGYAVEACERCGDPLVPRRRQRQCGACYASENKLRGTVNGGEERIRAAEHHDMIVRRLTSTPRPTYAQVAAETGTTPDAVKSYWRRHLKRTQATAPVDYASDVVDRWVRIRPEGLPYSEAAARIGVDPSLLNMILGRARRAGDERLAVAA